MPNIINHLKHFRVKTKIWFFIIYRPINDLYKCVNEVRVQVHPINQQIFLHRRLSPHSPTTIAPTQALRTSLEVVNSRRPPTWTSWRQFSRTWPPNIAASKCLTPIRPLRSSRPLSSNSNSRILVPVTCLLNIYFKCWSPLIWQQISSRCFWFWYSLFDLVKLYILFLLFLFFIFEIDRNR